MADATSRTDPEFPAITTAIAAVPHGTLGSRTFLGLLIAQFLAAFNDQAIHAAAMFFPINTQCLTEENAISLMPILFYAPWAIFGTVAGWLADRILLPGPLGRLFPEAYSAGDLVSAAGLAVTLFLATRSRAPQPRQDAITSR